MRRLIFITQQVDPEHPVLAGAVTMARALAARVDELVVLADGAVDGALPHNCRVRPFRASSRIGRGLRFEQALALELRPRPLAVVAHMCPVYAVIAAPLVRPLGIPLLTWYTHWNAHLPLRLAELVSTRVVSVEERSFPLPTRKLVPLGHAIDIDEFACLPAGDRSGLRILVLGRLSPSKGIDRILRGFRLALDAGLDGWLDVRGGASTPEEGRHEADLRRLARELDLEGHAAIAGPASRSDVPGLYGAAGVLINNMRAGAPDKVVYEAAASCLPVLASNPVFDELVAGIEPPLLFARDRPEELAERLLALAAVDPAGRSEIGRVLRSRVVAHHSLDAWADGLLAAAGAS